MWLFNAINIGLIGLNIELRWSLVCDCVTVLLCICVCDWVTVGVGVCKSLLILFTPPLDLILLLLCAVLVPVIPVMVEFTLVCVISFSRSISFSSYESWSDNISSILSSPIGVIPFIVWSWSNISSKSCIGIWSCKFKWSKFWEISKNDGTSCELWSWIVGKILLSLPLLLPLLLLLLLLWLIFDVFIFPIIILPFFGIILLIFLFPLPLPLPDLFLLILPILPIIPLILILFDPLLLFTLGSIVLKLRLLLLPRLWSKFATNIFPLSSIYASIIAISADFDWFVPVPVCVPLGSIRGITFNLFNAVRGDIRPVAAISPPTTLLLATTGLLSFVPKNATSFSLLSSLLFSLLIPLLLFLLLFLLLLRLLFRLLFLLLPLLLLCFLLFIFLVFFVLLLLLLGVNLTFSPIVRPIFFVLLLLLLLLLYLCIDPACNCGAGAPERGVDPPLI